MAAAKLLREHGASVVRAAVTHCILNDLAYERLKDGPLDELITTNTIPVEPRDLPVTVLSARERVDAHVGAGVSVLAPVGVGVDQ